MRQRAEGASLVVHAPTKLASPGVSTGLWKLPTPIVNDAEAYAPAFKNSLRVICVCAVGARLLSMYALCFLIIVPFYSVRVADVSRSTEAQQTML